MRSLKLFFQRMDREEELVSLKAKRLKAEEEAKLAEAVAVEQKGILEAKERVRVADGVRQGTGLFSVSGVGGVLKDMGRGLGKTITALGAYGDPSFGLSDKRKSKSKKGSEDEEGGILDPSRMRVI